MATVTVLFDFYCFSHFHSMNFNLRNQSINPKGSDRASGFTKSVTWLQCGTHRPDTVWSELIARLRLNVVTAGHQKVAVKVQNLVTYRPNECDCPFGQRCIVGDSDLLRRSGAGQINDSDLFFGQEMSQQQQTCPLTSGWLLDRKYGLKYGLKYVVDHESEDTFRCVLLYFIKSFHMCGHFILSLSLTSIFP